MKFLLIVRHAKSSWIDPGLDDLDRPLNKRGKKDAPRMGARLAERGFKPDCVISSPAKRAGKTAKAIALAAGYPVHAIRLDKAMYLASVPGLTDLIRKIGQGFSRVILVGHNPGLTDLVNILSDFRIGNLPTCGMACFSFDVTTWADIEPGEGKLEFFMVPEKSDVI
jgi:phosphohistidine phosphatase